MQVTPVVLSLLVLLLARPALLARYGNEDWTEFTFSAGKKEGLVVVVPGSGQQSPLYGGSGTIRRGDQTVSR